MYIFNNYMIYKMTTVNFALPIFDLAYYNERSRKYTNVYFNLLDYKSDLDNQTSMLVNDRSKFFVSLPLNVWYKSINNKNRRNLNFFNLVVESTRPKNFPIDTKSGIYSCGFLFNHRRALFLGIFILVINLYNYKKSNMYDQDRPFMNFFKIFGMSSLKSLLYFSFGPISTIFMFKDFIYGNMSKHLIPNV